jgi:hypothetical protein
MALEGSLQLGSRIEAFLGLNGIGLGKHWL